MNQFQAALAARTYEQRRAQRTARLRHRRLIDTPLAIVLFQPGAEPFAAAALGWGDAPGGLHLAVAGEPLNRELQFAMTLQLARWFNSCFEAPAERREEGIALAAPQILVANDASRDMLGRLGRRLAYLSPTGPFPADPALIRFGQHLLFLERESWMPGQQLVLALSDLLRQHWMTPQSELERMSLPALDAFIEPPDGVGGFDAAAEAERIAVGPVLDADVDDGLEPLIATFNEKRAGSTDPSVVAPLLRPIERVFRPLVQRTWSLLWRCWERERQWPEAPSVERRWREDCRRYTQHIDWTRQNGRRRTRQTHRQAAVTKQQLEEAQRILLAEEACDDPLRMIPYLLDNKAVRGRVVQLDLAHSEPGPSGTRRVKRPLLALDSDDECLMPRGKKLWWTEHPCGKPWIVESTRVLPGGGTQLVLKLSTGSKDARLPDVGDTAVFSVHTTEQKRHGSLPQQTPWTHQPETPPKDPKPIDGGEAQP